jgi:hypothetical protein
MEPVSSWALQEEMLGLLPTDSVPANAKRLLKELSQELDQLLFLDEIDELAADRKTLVRIANNKDFIPEVLRDVFLVETSKHLGRRLKEIGNGRRRAWHEARKYGLPIQPFSMSELRAWGIDRRTTTDELTIIVKKHMRVPTFIENDNPRELYDSIVKKFQVNRTLWDCVVANLGFWAALTLGGGLIIFGILCLSGVPWPIALLIAGIYQTAATAYVLGQCALNPYFHQF